MPLIQAMQTANGRPNQQRQTQTADDTHVQLVTRLNSKWTTLEALHALGVCSSGTGA